MWLHIERRPVMNEQEPVNPAPESTTHPESAASAETADQQKVPSRDVEDAAPDEHRADSPAVESAPPEAPDGSAPGVPEPVDDAPAPVTERVGTRRTTRETQTTTRRLESETVTHETSTTVEDIPVVPPLFAATSGTHPRPVG
jgi:hypothetical protein